MSDIIKTYEEEKATKPTFDYTFVYDDDIYNSVDRINTIHDANDDGMHAPRGVFDDASSNIIPVPNGATESMTVPDDTEMATDGHNGGNQLQVNNRPRRNAGSDKGSWQGCGRSSSKGHNQLRPSHWNASILEP